MAVAVACPAAVAQEGPDDLLSRVQRAAQVEVAASIMGKFLVVSWSITNRSEIALLVPTRYYTREDAVTDAVCSTVSDDALVLRLHSPAAELIPEYGDYSPLTSEVAAVGRVVLKPGVTWRWQFNIPLPHVEARCHRGQVQPNPRASEIRRVRLWMEFALGPTSWFDGMKKGKSRVVRPGEEYIGGDIRLERRAILAFECPVKGLRWNPKKRSIELTQKR
jgi:hypothetical protein